MVEQCKRMAQTHPNIPIPLEAHALKARFS